MADGVRKTVAFLATYVEELVRLQKPALEAVLKSNRAKQVKEWKAKKSVWSQHYLVSVIIMTAMIFKYH